MSKLPLDWALEYALKQLPEDERNLPPSIRNLLARCREVRKSGRGSYVRLGVSAAEKIVEDYKALRERLAMCRNDLDKVRHGIGLPRYGRVAQFRRARKPAKVIGKVEPGVVPSKWAKVIEGLKKG